MPPSKDGFAKRIARGTFAHESVAVRIDKEAIAAGGSDVLHESRARGAVRVQLNIGKADDVGTGFAGNRDALALCCTVDVRGADALIERHFFPDPGVFFLAHRNVSAETAGGDDGTGSIDRYRLFAVPQCLDAYDRTVFHNEVLRRGIRQNFNTVAEFLQALFEN